MDAAVKYFLENWGIPGAALLLAGWLVLHGVKFVSDILKRMSEIQKDSSATQNSLDKGQQEITLKAMDMSKSSQEQLNRLQDRMIEEQQNNQRAMHRFTDEITIAVLRLTKIVSDVESLIEHVKGLVNRVNDWDARLGLYMRRQDEQGRQQLQIINLLNTILSNITAKDIQK
jgi:predicted PurR-regulated permease PerM